jgi:hypothetical protein
LKKCIIGLSLPKRYDLIYSIVLLASGELTGSLGIISNPEKP